MGKNPKTNRREAWRTIAQQSLPLLSAVDLLCPTGGDTHKDDASHPVLYSNPTTLLSNVYGKKSE
jgi:hypothetical protein